MQQSNEDEHACEEAVGRLNKDLDDKRSELNDLASIVLYHLGEAYRDVWGLHRIRDRGR